MMLGDPKFGIYPGMQGNTKFFTALYASRHQTDSIPKELAHHTLLGNEVCLEQSHDQFLADLKPIIPDEIGRAHV